jgi:hypothetical protein
MLRNDDDLTPRERAMFAALPRHRVGSAALEDRVVAALMHRGLLHRMSAAFGRTPWRVVTQLAAAAAVFVMGAVYGQSSLAASKQRSAPTGPDLVSMQNEQTGEVKPEDLAPLIKRVGTAYVSVLSMLPADTVDTLARFAHQAAKATWRAAASQMARVHSADSVRAVLHVADSGMTLAPVRR